MKKTLFILFVAFNLFACGQDSPIIVPLGSDCHVGSELRWHNIRNQAFPFDWNITSFEGLCRLIENDFAHFLDENYLVLREDKNAVLNTYYNISFVHDFPNYNPRVLPEKQLDIQPYEMPQYETVQNFLEFIESIREKYNRRIQRFREVANGDQKVVFIRNQVISKDQAVKLYSLIQDKFPNLDFILVACGESQEMRTDWGIPGIYNFFARYVLEDWTEIFKSLKLLPETQ